MKRALSSQHFCSCGDASTHVVADRRMLDGTRVLFWSDGDVTTWRDVRSFARAPLARPAFDLLLKWIESYVACELPAAIAAARRGKAYQAPRTRPRAWRNGCLVFVDGAGR